MVSRILIIEGCILEAVGLIWTAWKYESLDNYTSKFVGSPFEFVFEAAGDGHNMIKVNVGIIHSWCEQ